MKVLIKKKYYKTSSRKRSPIKFVAVQPEGKGTTVHATLHIDPVLRKHKDLRNAMLKHEVIEIKHWGEGGRSSHYHAKSKEPKLTRNMGLGGFWREIDRRKKGKWRQGTGLQSYGWDSSSGLRL